MRLPKPFYRLPLSFDVARLRAEVAAIPAQAWARHPNDLQGNSAVRLISVNGGENDDVDGVMAPTPHLQASPYLRQILAAFGVVWSRSRLLKLAPGAIVPEHADINYHWFNRVRLHIPIVTRPEVRFYCAEECVHMAAGEAWIFDNWRPHRVENHTPDERVHLVADTSGSAAFWRLVAQSEQATQVQHVAFQPQRGDAMPLTERTTLAPVMTPGEIDMLVLDLRAELVATDESPEIRMRLARYHAMLESMCRDWRQLYALYADSPSGWTEFQKLRDAVREASRASSDGLVMRTNRVNVHQVLEGRLLRAMLTARPSIAPGIAKASTAGTTNSRSELRLRAPVFIVAAPRSGSTLLFETLACSEQITTLGGEAHWLVEGMEQLRPGAPGVDSNRLTAQHATASVVEQIKQQIATRRVDREGRPVPADDPRLFLEKTPKNSLRIPFFNSIFPDARYIFLWRDPRENIASIMEAWRSGGWKTYPQLPGFAGPWSLLLPPGWSEMNGRSLEQIAAWQWRRTNEIVLEDLAALPQTRWTSVEYSELLNDPASAVLRILNRLGLQMDAPLRERVSGPLPQSKYTLTAPAADKWRKHESEIARELPALAQIWQRLQQLR